MKLEKAIAILEALYRGGISPNDPHPQDALKLGSEALKYRLRLEQENGDITLEPLPGETEE